MAPSTHGPAELQLLAPPFVDLARCRLPESILKKGIGLSEQSRREV